MKTWTISAALISTLISTFLLIPFTSATSVSKVESTAKSKYIAQNPTDANAYLNRGMSRYNAGDKKGAITDFNQSIKINPKNADVYNERGITLAELGDIKGAIADFDQAIKLNPSIAQSYHNRGNAYAILEDKQRAIRDFKKAAELYGTQGNQKMQSSSLQMLKRLQN